MLRTALDRCPRLAAAAAAAALTAGALLAFPAAGHQAAQPSGAQVTAAVSWGAKPAAVPARDTWT